MPDDRSRSASRRATPRRAASSSPPPKRPGSTCRATSHPLLGRDGETLAMDVVRDGPADAARLLLISSACHGVEGYLRLGRAGRAARRRGVSRRGARRRRRRALRPRAEPLRLLVVAAHDARERRPEPQLPRLQPAAAAEPGLRRAGRAARAADLAAVARPCRPAIARYVAEHGLARAADAPSRAGSTRIPRACSTAASTRPGATSRCATCCASTGTRAQRLAWIDLHTGLGPSGHGERIFACRDDAAGAGARARLVGRRRSPRSTTAVPPRRR